MEVSPDPDDNQRSARQQASGFDDEAVDPQVDTISDLLAACVGEAGLSDEEMLALLPGPLLAGHETTANIIANTM